MAHPLLEVKGISVGFQTAEGFINVVNDVSFGVERGQCVGLVGESGSGKSVTSLSIMQLIPVPVGRITSGEVLYNGKDVCQMSVAELRRYRGSDVAMIFQEPMTALNPVYTVGSQMMEVFKKELPKDEARERIVGLLRRVGLAEPELLLKSYIHELSGGMRQRVMIAMAIANNPKVLIADEPTTALDVTIQAQIMELIKEVQASMGMAMLLITHDLGVVFEMCSYAHVMYAGRIVESCSITELYDSPAHPYTRGLLDSLPIIDSSTKRKDRLQTISGNVPSVGNYPSGCNFHPRCPYKTETCKRVAPPLETTGRRRVACHHPLSARKQGNNAQAAS